MVHAFLLMFVCFMSIYMNARKLCICFCLKAIKYLIYCGMFHCISSELNLLTCGDITNPSPFFSVFLTPFNQLMKRYCFVYAIWRKMVPLLFSETCMKTRVLWQFLKHFSFRALFSLSAVVTGCCLVPHKHAHLPTLKHHPSAASPALSPSRCNEKKTKIKELFLFFCHFLSLFYKMCSSGTFILLWLWGFFLVLQFTILPDSQPWELLLLSHRHS